MIESLTKKCHITQVLGTNVKTVNKLCYIEVVEGLVNCLTNTLFNGDRWILLQESGETNKAKTAQNCLKVKIVGFKEA